jgi:hypothetical protein
MAKDTKAVMVLDIIALFKVAEAEELENQDVASEAHLETHVDKLTMHIHQKVETE